MKQGPYKRPKSLRPGLQVEVLERDTGGNSVKLGGAEPDALETMAPGVCYGWGLHNAPPKAADAGFLARKEEKG